MPLQIGRFALVVGALLLLLLLFLIGRVHSNPDHAAASLLQNARFDLAQQQQQRGPLFVEMVVELPSASGYPHEYYDRDAVQLNYIDDMATDGHKLSSELGRLQDLQMAIIRYMGMEQWKGASTVQGIKMGRSYRKFLEGRSLQEEQLLSWFKCQPSGFDDDEGAAESKYINIATLEMFRAYTPSRAMQVAGILEAFLTTHPSFFLHLALAFLLIAFLASLLYFSLD